MRRRGRKWCREGGGEGEGGGEREREGGREREREREKERERERERDDYNCAAIALKTCYTLQDLFRPVPENCLHTNVVRSFLVYSLSYNTSSWSFSCT